MRFETFGERQKPAVLFFHAMGVTGASSEPVAAHLQDRYFCILPTSTVYCAGQTYGNAPQGEEEFVARYKGLTETLLQNPSMFGFCYTQLYDIEQEINGLYTYERKPKFDMTQIHKANAAKAAIED